jgi:hypothetical protein
MEAHPPRPQAHSTSPHFKVWGGHDSPNSPRIDALAQFNGRSTADSFNSGFNLNLNTIQRSIRVHKHSHRFDVALDIITGDTVVTTKM